jgi:hypothetical protein
VTSESNITTNGVGLSLTVSQERLVGLVRGVPVKPMAGDGLVALNGYEGIACCAVVLMSRG